MNRIHLKNRNEVRFLQAFSKSKRLFENAQEADILNRWARHTEYRGLTMDVWKNAAVHGIKEPRGSRGIDSTGMVFKGMQDFLPAFADFSRASPYDFTHVALTLPLTVGGDVLGLLQTEHSGIDFNPFVNASHTDAERHYFGKDHLGSIRAVTNQWGSPLYMFDYDVFGQPLQDRPERFRHGFTGKEYDGWTGLYNYGFRDYSPVLGRFTTVDPIQDDHNWYAYVNSDPVNWLDPWGLEPCKQESGEDIRTKIYKSVQSTYQKVIDMKKHFKMDKFGLEILQHYLYGLGTEKQIPITNESWGKYMRDSGVLTLQINRYLLDETKKFDKTESSHVFSFSKHMETNNGEGIIGYNYLHGSDSKLGDVEVHGVMKRLEDGSISVFYAAQWNDTMNPNLQYPSDRVKAKIGDIISLGKARDYILRIQWHNETILPEYRGYE